ncbi:FecR family protein [Sphingomonas sp.]|uniref:FecR family protein n=1 Tax=Sphingomonas sp. TaxID=28214 RepID=UPI003B3AE340
MHDDVDLIAAAWATRHPLGAEDRRALDAWLAEDPRHAGALLRAQAGLSAVNRVLVEGIDHGQPWRQLLGKPDRRWFMAAGGLAAGALGLIGWPKLAGERIETARGEIRRLPLEDGSVATIDTSSALRVKLSSRTREIALQRGQAWFQVAKDRNRPFVVDAGRAQVRAIGTAFSVHREGGRVQVAVTEGRVAVWARDASGAMSILDAGQYATFTGAEAVPVTGSAPGAIERSLAWRNGEIALENETLGNAVAQFNRYNQVRLVVDDEALAGERLVGLFRLDDPALFAETVATSLNVAVLTGTHQIRLVRKNKKAI